MYEGYGEVRKKVGQEKDEYFPSFNSRGKAVPHFLTIRHVVCDTFNI